MFYRRKGSKFILGKHHEIICDALTKVFNGEIKRLIINLPPRYSKTELAVKNFIAWTLGHYPDSQFIHTSYSADLAFKNSADTRDIIQSEEYQKIFGTRLASTKVNHFVTTAGGVMYATGAGGSITGFGAGGKRDAFCGAIIIDDPHKADEALSETMRSRVKDWFQNTLESRKNSKDTPIILIMQRLHEDDLAGFLLNGGNGEKWEHICFPAINDGAPLWEAMHGIEELRRMEQAAPYVFATQYMQNPAPLDGGIFKPSMINVIDAIPAGTRFVRGWDLASSLKGDFTAGAKLGVTPNGRYVIADITRARVEPEARDAMIMNAAALDGRNTVISIPQDPGQAGKTQVLYLVKKLSGYAVRTSPESGDKVTRALPFASQVNVGNVDMIRASWNGGLIEEMRMFPNGRHDDQIDALSRAFGEFVTGAPSLRIA